MKPCRLTANASNSSSHVPHDDDDDVVVVMQLLLLVFVFVSDCDSVSFIFFVIFFLVVPYICINSTYKLVPPIWFGLGFIQIKNIYIKS